LIATRNGTSACELGEVLWYTPKNSERSNVVMVLLLVGGD
jgi:hypothetical protein